MVRASIVIAAAAVASLIGGIASGQAKGSVQQVNVSVKVVEFQTGKNAETGLAAYFQRRNKQRPFGRVTSGNGAVRSADITFPLGAGGSALSVFVDRIRLSEGDLEVLLQALVDENRAFILSRPKVMITVGSEVPTIIKTTQAIPYESTVVVGATAVQTTEFRETGVSLKVTCPEVIDDDGDMLTTDDMFIRLNVEASVMDIGKDVTVALDNRAGNVITVPEFINRSVSTSVWVRHGQVLILGGLYRNTKEKRVKTLPWLLQGEDALLNAAESVVPVVIPYGPISTGLGNRTTDHERRELVFLIKAELWRPAYAIGEGIGFGALEEEDNGDSESPQDTISQVIQDISSIPKAVAKEVAGKSSTEAENAGGTEE